MSPITVVAHLQTSSGDTREQVLHALSKVSQYAHTQEPGVGRYAVTIPAQQAAADGEHPIYIIEEYADQATLSAHLRCPPVVSLLELLSSPQVLAVPTKVWQLESYASYTRPEAGTHANALIVFGQLRFREGTSKSALEDFKRTCDFSQASEPGTLSYNVFRNPEAEEEVKTVEVYVSKEYLWDPHACSEVVKGNIVAQKDSRLGLELTLLEKVGGYFYKESSC